MIKLDEKDIKAVGRSRFSRKTSKQFSIIIISCFVLLFILSFYLREFDTPISLIPIIPVLGILGYMIWYVRNMNKAEKYFVARWNKDNGQ